MKKFGFILAALSVSALSFGCTEAVDTEPIINEAQSGIFLTVISIEGAPIPGTITATRSEGPEAGAGFEAPVDSGGRTFLPLGAGGWVLGIRNAEGTLLDCGPLDALVNETGVSAQTITCNDTNRG